jgi:ABC-type glycerol-3-phosphate transport system substrate-binding protein
MEITWMYRFKDSWFIHELNEKFNVEIKANGIWRNDREKANLMLASGEAPEVFGGWTDGLKLYEDGITRSFPKSMVEQYAPGCVKTFDKRPLAWLLEKCPDKEGEYIGLTAIDENVDGPIYWPSTRTDYIRNVGFELKSYESEKQQMDRFGRCWYFDEDYDLDWFEALLVAFKNGDPDGNGKIDTIPVCGCTSIHNSWSSLMGAFGLPYLMTMSPQGIPNYEENGELYVTPISPRMREFLRLMQKWYKMGLIDPEFPTLGYSKMWAKVTAGTVGMMFGSNASYIGCNERPPNGWCTEEEAAAGVNVVILNPPIGPGGIQGVQAFLPVTGMKPDASLRIRKDVSDEKLKRILAIYDYMEFDTEGWIYRFYGKPGVHFDWSGTSWKSAGNRRAAEDVPAEYKFNNSASIQMSLYPQYYLKDSTARFLRPEELNVWWENVFYGSVGQRLSIYYNKWDMFGETNLRDLYEQYGEGLNTMLNEFYIEAIIGDKNLDADWDAYAANWRKNGGNEVIAEMKKAPLVLSLKKGIIKY